MAIPGGGSDRAFQGFYALALLALGFAVGHLLTEGEGRGLWLVYWTVRKSDGELSFRDRESGGAVGEILLPAAE